MSVKVPLAVWQWFRMEGIQRGTSLQDVCSAALAAYMEGHERMRDPALQGATFTDDGNTITAIPGAAFSPAARGEDVATAERLFGSACRVLLATPGGGHHRCGADLDDDGACPHHGINTENFLTVGGLAAGRAAVGETAAPADDMDEMIAAAAAALDEPDVHEARPTVAEAEAAVRQRAVDELAARKAAAKKQAPKRSGQVEPRMKP